MWSKAIENRSQTVRLVTSAAARTTMLMIVYIFVSEVTAGAAAEAAAGALLFFGPLTFGLTLWILGWQADKNKAMQADPTLSAREYFKQTIPRTIAGAILGISGIVLIFIAIFSIFRWDESMPEIALTVYAGCGGLLCVIAATKLLGMSGKRTGV